MSKWRYEVTKETCKYGDMPKYVVYSGESIKDYYTKHFLKDVSYAEAWLPYTSEIPTRAIMDNGSKYYLKPYTYGNKKSWKGPSLEEVFPARRIGRMFPRHKKQIIYVG